MPSLSRARIRSFVPVARPGRGPRNEELDHEARRAVAIRNGQQRQRSERLFREAFERRPGPLRQRGPLGLLGGLVGGRFLLGGDLLLRLVDRQLLELRVHERHLRRFRLEPLRGADAVDEALDAEPEIHLELQLERLDFRPGRELGLLVEKLRQGRRRAGVPKRSDVLARSRRRGCAEVRGGGGVGLLRDRLRRADEDERLAALGERAALSSEREDVVGFLDEGSKRSRNSFSGVFRSGSRRAQKSATNFSASWSDAIFFHSFFSSSVARYAYSGDLSQSLYLSRAARVGNAAAKERRSRERAEQAVRFMGDFLPVAGAGRGPPPRSRQPREYTSVHSGQGWPETESTFDPSRRMVILESVPGLAREAHDGGQTLHPACGSPGGTGMKPAARQVLDFANQSRFLEVFLQVERVQVQPGFCIDAYFPS